MSTRALVSIIVPTRNQARWLRATLDSILAQGHRPLEVLVMDGASTDGTTDILREYATRHPELHWRSEPDRGPADAVNKGLAEARGEFAGIQSSDDLYRQGAIAEAVAELQRDASLALVCGDMVHIDAENRPLPGNRIEPAFSRAGLLSRGMIIHQSSAFFRLPLARELGGWNARYFCCDTELWLRMSFRGAMRKVDRVWSERRVHPGQRDREARKMLDSWNCMIDESAELKAAPLGLRLAARAGRHVVALDYNPGLSRLAIAAHAWSAVLSYPPVLFRLRKPGALVPGAGRIGDWLRQRFAADAAP